MRTHHYCLGLDLGRQADFSALAVLRWPVAPPPAQETVANPKAEKVERSTPVYEVPLLKRWPLGTAYLDITADVVRLMQRPELAEARPVLVVDATGVGDAVFEMVHKEMMQAEVKGSGVAVTITAGSAVTALGGGRWRVAKKQLVSVLQVLLGQRRLRIAEALPEAKTLQRELGTFSVKITEAANETFESWRERDHDDLVLGTALAAWWAESWTGIPTPASGGPEPRRQTFNERHAATMERWRRRGAPGMGSGMSMFPPHGRTP